MDGWGIGEAARAGPESVCAVRSQHHWKFGARCCENAQFRGWMTLLLPSFIFLLQYLKHCAFTACMHSECTPWREIFNLWKALELAVLHFVWFPHARRKQKAKQDSYFSYADWFFMISISWFARFASNQRHLTMINISARCSDNEINIFFLGDESFSCSWRFLRPKIYCRGGRESIGILCYGFSVIWGSFERHKKPLKPHFLLWLFFRQLTCCANKGLLDFRVRRLSAATNIFFN